MGQTVTMLNNCILFLMNYYKIFATMQVYAKVIQHYTIDHSSAVSIIYYVHFFINKSALCAYTL